MTDSLTHLINTLQQFRTLYFFRDNNDLTIPHLRYCGDQLINTICLPSFQISSFKMFWTSTLSISSRSDTEHIVSQSSSSFPLTQYGSSVGSSAGTIVEITIFSGSAPGSDLIVKWPPSCLNVFPLLIPHLVCPILH